MARTILISCLKFIDLYMPQITIQQLSIGYQGPQLLNEVDCRIDAGERIGLLGRNGAGKTTFMRLLMGMEKADQGTIEFAPNTRLAFLQQDVPDQSESTIEQVVLSGLDADYHDLENHWQRDQIVEQTLSQLELDGSRLFASLSAGLKRRALLGKAIVGKPDILLLDEPTNHLDIDSITWLEGFLASQRFTLIFVTHDRQFLRRLATRILEVDRGRLFDWTCDYDTFLKRKELALAAEEKQQALFDKRLAEEEVWIRTGIKARRTRNEGRVRRLEEMRRVRSQRPKAVGNVRMQIDTGERSGQLVCDLQDASFGYDGKQVVMPFDLTIMRGDKIGILGRNGIGKSTLLKGLLGELSPLSGSVRLGTKLEIAYFDQTREILDPMKTAEENVGEGKTTIEVAGQSRHIIGYLQDFLFTPEQARTPIRFFSGGQRNRLLLAKLFARPANMLVMDEPTNDLDSETLELLEERLVDYEGTLIVVSHDRAFLNNCVTSLLVFEDGDIKEYVGGYDDWLRQRSNSESPTSSSKAASKSTSAEPTGSTKPPAVRKLSYKERVELDQLPGKIEAIEQEQSTLHAKMAEPAYYKSAQAIQQADRARLAELDELLANSYSRWEELSS
ncbi:MAG: ATP-binding cassette domain-containing protein [Pirellulales bacterium]